MEKKTNVLSVVVAVLLLQLAVSEDVTDTRKSIHVTTMEGKMQTFECDLPMSNPPHVVWKNMVFNFGKNPDVMFDSSINDSHLMEDYVENKFSISLDTFAITFNTSSKKFEGEYWCESHIDGNVKTKSYDLKTPRELPKCTIKAKYVKGEQMSVKCLVRDTVEINMHPPLEGSKGDGDFDSSEIKYEAKASPELDGKNFECRIRNNTELSCDFKFVVEYGLTNLTGPSDKTHIVGEKISCSALGNPTPELSMLINDKEVISEVANTISYKLGEDLVNEEGTLVKCLGRNTIEKVDTNAETVSNITVSNLPAEGQSLLGESGNFILIIIIIIVALLLLLIIIAFLLFRRRRNAQSQKPKQATLLKAENRKDYMNDSIGA